MEEAIAFEYYNRTGRPTAPFVSAAAKVLPGVAYVQRQHVPYAEAWREANLDALTRPGPRWIVFGDSMSQGIGASRFDAGWVNQVRDRLAGDGFGYEIINLSASGARATDVLTQQIPAWRALPPAPSGLASLATGASPATRPDLITVLIGSNDLLSRPHREQLATTFAEVLRELPRGTVVATLPQPRRAARAANAVIAAARAERGLVVVDMRASGPSSWRGRLAEDHFHPNNDGYQAIGQAFEAAIRGARPASD